MKTFRKHLHESLKNKKFKEVYDEEKELLALSLAMHEARKKAGLSQSEIAEKAHLTQQQVSKIEKGENCNIMTYMKVSHATGFRIAVQPVTQSLKRSRNAASRAGLLPARASIAACE
jgi:DNA-binding XRE family transcriptional regulator